MITENATGLDALIGQISAEADNEDLAAVGALNYEAIAEDIWQFANEPAAGKRAVRLRSFVSNDRNNTKGVCLEAVGPNVPFLVDSLIGECAAQSLEVKTLFHPVFKREDGQETSAIQIYLPALVDRERQNLLQGARTTLEHIDAAVHDFAAMVDRMATEINALHANQTLDPERRDEAVALLDWFANKRFVFLGVRTYVFDADANGKLTSEEPSIFEGSNLGILRDESRNVLHRNAEPTVIGEEIEAFLSEPSPLIIAKSTLISRVHRRVPADYIGVKQYDASGKVIGETRFLGLFTADAYNDSAREIPMIRRRIRQVVEQSGASTGGHSETGLYNILENWPRDELFQTNVETLKPMALGALHLIGRPRTRLFVRKDRFGRFVSVLVYVLRDAYDSDLRVRLAQMLCDAFKGELKSFQPQFDDGPMARVHFQIELGPDSTDPDIEDLERRAANLARRWEDAFRDLLSDEGLDERVREGSIHFVNAFNAAYREAFDPQAALRDIEALAELSADTPILLRTFSAPGDREGEFNAKIYARENSVPLSDCVPVLEDMGLFVEFETGYRVKPTPLPIPGAVDTYWIHHLKMRLRSGANVDLSQIDDGFENAFAAVWMGLAESDGFNRLIFTAGLDWRQAALMRALCAYRRQTGLDPDRQTQIEALVAYPNITRGLADLFATLFDPASTLDLQDRKSAARRLMEDIEADLVAVKSLEHDRVLRRLALLIGAIKRTSFYQPDAPALSFKVACQELEDLPAPKPFREIFVASPRVEGVHLRFGKVARGGLRWSDRRDDFRTEVLGLVKAQQVKNAVIVPVGSKGGFFPKQMPENATREVMRQEGIASYRLFISSLLALTDNLVDGRVTTPKNVVIHDEEDPYLVVAADKGTATFSDIANEISVSMGFWLGDAFASGGSAGYDHKKMGITARGGWEAVKRHFRELGKDIQSEPFTVVGVGDMSGDVFGNGMLLSNQIKLLAAFNHLHIFVDPNPADTQASFEERQRLFDLPRSSWNDYDTGLISKGGGVFDRSAKSIELTPEIKAMTALSADKVTPDELLNAILKSEAELMWFGGIGTYVKSVHETNADVGDRANDAIRIDANMLRVKVIGEGANLGMTQEARIDFAKRGGLVNTDAIDNSAGVDSSDHEVNIKILLGEAIRSGALPSGERNNLLASMTDDVARHVLAHNYAQTGALSLAERNAKVDVESYENLMRWLEGRGVLDRQVEDLPISDSMASRKAAGYGLTRPEISVIMAWSKIVLFDDLVATDLPDDPALTETLAAYFPGALGQYGDAMQNHRLKREIIATVLANRVIDILGPVRLNRLRDAFGQDVAAMMRAFEVARLAVDLNGRMAAVAALDNKVPADVQTDMHDMIANGIMKLTLALGGKFASVGEGLDTYKEPLLKFIQQIGAFCTAHHRTRMERTVRDLVELGVPETLAREAAGVGHVGEGVPLIELAREKTLGIGDVAPVFYGLISATRTDRILSIAETELETAGRWDRRAMTGLMRQLHDMHLSATRNALADGAQRHVESFMRAREDEFADLRANLLSFGLGKEWSFAKFALVTDAVRACLLK